MRILFLLFICSIIYTPLCHAQPTPTAAASVEYWYRALGDFKKKNFQQALHLFRQHEREEGHHPKTQSYIGDCYYSLQQLDSALYFYQKALETTHSPLSALNCKSKITRCHLQLGDFRAAFNSAYVNYQAQPDSDHFRLDLRDVCLWAYLTRHQNLSREYLTRYTIHNAYIVNSVAAQKVIARNLRSEWGEPFVFDDVKNIGYAERWYGYFSAPEEEEKLYFIFTETDFDDALKRQEIEAMRVFKNEDLPLYERLGALYFLAPLDNDKLKVLLHYEALPIRYCVCQEVRSYVSERYKRVCRKDKRAEIQKIIAINKALQ